MFSIAGPQAPKTNTIFRRTVYLKPNHYITQTRVRDLEQKRTHPVIHFTKLQPFGENAVSITYFKLVRSNLNE